MDTLDKLIIDIDGTILDGNEELNHASRFLNHLEHAGKNYLLATNSIKSKHVQVQRFRNIGLSVLPEKIYSPIDAINKMLLQENISNVMIVGSNDEIGQINANHTFQDPELIILLDFEKNNMSYNDLQRIINKIEKGCAVIAASGSLYYLNNGRKQIDTGAFVCLIESIIGRKIDIYGKPSSHYFLNAKSILGVHANSVTVIGDDWKDRYSRCKKDRT